MKYFAITILTMLLVAGCSKGQSNAAPSEKKQTQQTQNKAETPAVKTVTIAELLKAPKAYDGQEVVVQGVFTSFCPDGDFVIKDGFDSLEFYITEQVPMPPKSKLGSKIRIRGMVKVRRNEVSIIAKEVKFE